MAKPFAARKERFLTRIRQRFSLRLHMSLILLGTTSAGVGANWLFLRMGITPLAVRIVLAVALTYVVFLLLVRLWLAIVCHSKEEEKPKSSSSVWDHLDVPTDLGGVGGGKTPPVFAGAGGQFGGGGSSASFTGGNVQASVGSAPAPSSGGGWGGFSFGLDLDGEGLVLLIAFIVLVGSFFIAGGYLVYEAPVILAETLFEFSLASLLLKKLKKTEQGDWFGHLLKLTWKPFTGVMVVTFLFAGLVLHLRPAAHRLSDLWKEEPPATAETIGDSSIPNP